MTPKERAKDTRLRKVYGITLEEYNKLLFFQGGGCAFCGRPFEEGKRFSVDHSHVAPFEVRGIVCYQDNRYKIGSFTIEEAWKLYEYLSNPPATRLFGYPRSVPVGMEKGQPRKRKRRTVKRSPKPKGR